MTRNKLRPELDDIPLPFENGAPLRCMVTGLTGEWRTAWGWDGCRKPEAFGPVYTSPKEATAASRYINSRTPKWSSTEEES